MIGLNIFTRFRAMIARLSRRISSSLLPANIGPPMASIQPKFPVTMSIYRKPHLIMGKWSQRVVVPEMLDHAPLDAARARLRDLTRVNRYLGRYLVLGKLFAEVAQAADRFSVLDIGAASGDMGAAIRR